MDPLGRVYILLPDFTVVAGYVGDKCDDMYRIDIDEQKISIFGGRSVYRRQDDIFYDEKVARARKFMKRFKMMLRTGHTMDEAWASESNEITELAINLWPEELL